MKSFLCLSLTVCLSYFSLSKSRVATHRMLIIIYSIFPPLLSIKTIMKKFHNFLETISIIIYSNFCKLLVNVNWTTKTKTYTKVIEWNEFIVERFAQYSSKNVRLTHLEFLYFRYVLPKVEADVTSGISNTDAVKSASRRDSWIWVQNLKNQYKKFCSEKKWRCVVESSHCQHINDVMAAFCVNKFQPRTAG